MKGSKGLQLTLGILKPDLVLHPVYLKCVLEKIMKENFFIIKRITLQWEKENAELFYQEHQGKFFFHRLTSFMCSGPIMPMVLAREDAISHWRQLLGPTKTTKARLTHPASIRGLYGVTDTRNAAHGADSCETAEKEMKFFFPRFNAMEWMKKYEEHFQRGQVIFDEVSGTHKVISQ